MTTSALRAAAHALLCLAASASVAFAQDPAPDAPAPVPEAEESAPEAPASVAYWTLDVRDLPTVDGEGPVEVGPSWPTWLEVSTRPWAIVDGEGVAFVIAEGERRGRRSSRSPALLLAARGPADAPLTGTLCMPGPDGGEWSRRRFELAVPDDPLAARDDFLRANVRRRRDLRDAELPGAAWFRHRAREAERSLEAFDVDDPESGWVEPPGLAEHLEETYALFTGARAVAENLRLDEVLDPGRGGELTSSVARLRAVTVPPHEWGELGGPPIDALARAIPADQYGAFFPSFASFAQLVDEVRASGAPVLALFDPRSEVADVVERAERQLGVRLDTLASIAGKGSVARVALTSSDPYVRSGTDLVVLLTAREGRGDLLQELFLRSQRLAARRANLEVREEPFGDVTARVARNPERSVSSYFVRTGDVFVLSNSPVQVRRVLATLAGETPALAASNEMRFFRDRYPLGAEGEDALVVVPDAAIRRWVGPRWRVGASRRIRAAAVLASRTASMLAARREGVRERGDAKLPLVGAGRVEWIEGAPVDSAYGSTAFLTPIAELAIDALTLGEATAYAEFRDRYERGWSRAFDPVGASLSVEPGAVGLDLSIFPLTEWTDYEDLRAFAGEAKLTADAPGRHAGALAAIAVALDAEGEELRGLQDQFGGMLDLAFRPLAWMGSSAVLFLDEDPTWDELAGVSEERREDRFGEMPVGVAFEVEDPLRLGLFVSSLRAYMEESAPGLAEWRTKEHAERPYVVIGTGALGAGPTQIAYATLPDRWILSFDEDVVKRALERANARDGAASDPSEGDGGGGPEGAGGPAEPAPEPWPERSAALRFRSGALSALRVMFDDATRDALRRRSWRNLPILNEWRRSGLAEDAVRFHAEHFDVRLVCPGGGEYVWDAEWGTWSSTVYGHPAAPRDGAAWPPAVEAVLAGACDLLFELDGVRAAARIERE